LGQALGGILGADSGSGPAEVESTDPASKTGGGIGGLLGALGGGLGGDLGGGSDQQDGGLVPQPTFGATQPEPADAGQDIDTGDLAPTHAPLPVPAPANRKSLAAIRPAPEPQQVAPDVKPQTKDGGENPLKNLFDKDGELSPGQILKSLGN
jgi:hypothetical protein